MKVEIVLVIVILALVKGSENSDDSKETKETDHHVKHTPSLGVKRLTPNYQKNIQRFTTIKSVIPRSTSSHVYKPSHRPSTSTFKTPKATKAKNTNFWKIASTRRTFMKHMQFTLSPLSTTKSPGYSNNGKEILRKYKSILFNKKDDGSSEEITENSDKNHDKEKSVRSSISPFRRLRTKVVKANTAVDIPKAEDSEKESQIEVTTKNTIVSESDISSEELEDREEFIFVKPKEFKENAVDTMKDDSIESVETATVMEIETKTRRKRSINVIEEENLATTVSGFKFTGKVAPLSSDLIFRNINT